MSNNKRTWNTHIREPWNVRIFYILKAIDSHNDMYFKTLDYWHLEQAKHLRDYVKSLKEWISSQESTIPQSSEESDCIN